MFKKFFKKQNESFKSHKFEVQKPQMGIDGTRFAWNEARHPNLIFQTFNFERKSCQLVLCFISNM
jgi:hypothetical protein